MPKVHLAWYRLSFSDHLCTLLQVLSGQSHLAGSDHVSKIKLAMFRKPSSPEVGKCSISQTSQCHLVQTQFAYLTHSLWLRNNGKSAQRAFELGSIFCYLDTEGIYQLFTLASKISHLISRTNTMKYTSSVWSALS